jgi:hypothetical protein
MKRTALLTRSTMARAAVKPPKCPVCKRRTQDTRLRLHPECMEVWIARQVAKQDAAKKKRAAEVKRREREDTKVRKAAIKRLPDLIAEAQVAVNAYVRARDAGLPCICCGKPFEPMRPGGSMDAGHYLARSIAPQHRFNPDNIFGQRKNCNRPGGTTRGAFRAGVLARIGLERLEALEADVAVHKWQRDELIALRNLYRKKRKELERAKPESE